MNSLNIQLPDDVSDEVQRLAAIEGESISAFVEKLVSHCIKATRDMEALKARIARADPKVFMEVLEAVPDAPPMAGDELSPEELAYWREVNKQRKRASASAES